MTVSGLVGWTRDAATWAKHRTTVFAVFVVLLVGGFVAATRSNLLKR
jgi:hypothetical protein